MQSLLKQLQTEVSPRDASGLHYCTHYKNNCTSTTSGNSVVKFANDSLLFAHSDTDKHLSKVNQFTEWCTDKCEITQPPQTRPEFLAVCHDGYKDQSSSLVHAGHNQNRKSCSVAAKIHILYAQSRAKVRTELIFLNGIRKTLRTDKATLLVFLNKWKVLCSNLSNKRWILPLSFFFFSFLTQR